MTHTTGPRSGRRSFMRAIGAGAAGIGAAGLSGIAGAQDGSGNEPAGYLSIIYDDGPVEDYEMYRLHRRYGAAGCSATCPGLINSSNDWLSSGRLLEMSDNGWEIMSHTVDHRALGETPIVEDIEAGDTRIYPDVNIHGRFEGDPIAVFDGENEAEATVAGNGEDDTGPYIELETGIETGFTASSSTRVRYTEEFLREILSNSQTQLEEYVGEGQVTNLIYPFERDDGLVSELAPEYYVATPTHDGVGLNPTRDPDPYNLGRRYMETDRMTEAEIETFLDTVAEEPDYGILAGHSQYDTLPPERVEFVLQQAQERNIEVVSVQEALEVFGVAAAPERRIGANGSDENRTPNEQPDETPDENDSMGFFERIVAFLRSLFS